MSETPVLFRLSFGLGLTVVLLWLALETGLVQRRPRRGPRQPHAHGAPLPLPEPVIPRDGPDSGIPDFGPLPKFRLVESLGEPVTRENLEDKVWVASFLFTRCAGTCPTTAARSRMLQDTLPQGALLVSVSVDPENDTPAVLAKYAEGMNRRPGRWLFATGERAEVLRLTSRGFYLGSEEALFHSTQLAVVDGRGHLRGFYESTDDEAIARLVADVSRLLATRSAGAARPPAP